jgi:dihydrofolate reductase
VVVVGSTTYKTFGRPLKERVNIVYSREQTFEGAETTQDNPRDLIKKLEERGFKEVAICGGSHIYSMFLKAGVVDTIYLTIEPIIFGKGISLFNEDTIYHLKLKNSQVSESGGSLLLEYAVDYTGAPKMTE